MRAAFRSRPRTRQTACIGLGYADHGSACPVLAVSPQAFTFNYTVGGVAPVTQDVSITNNGGSTLSWIASASAAWTLSFASGTPPAVLSVSVNPATWRRGPIRPRCRLPQRAQVQNSDFVNGLLPISSSGVSVTINGLAAYFEYISPTQVNVLTPDDTTVSAVQVQVTTVPGTSPCVSHHIAAPADRLKQIVNSSANLNLEERAG